MNDRSLKGTHIIKDFDITERSVRCMMNSKTVFEIPTREISNCMLSANELEIQLNDEHVSGPGDFLTEIRFFVHQPQSEENPLEPYANKIRQFINAEDQGDELICKIPELPFVTPRGKYSANFYAKEFKIHGNSYTFSIRYSNILKAFKLNMPEDDNVCVVFNLDKPIRQGQTEYSWLYIQFKKSKEVEVEFFAKPELLARNKIALPESNTGIFHELFLQVFSAVSKIHITGFTEKKDEPSRHEELNPKLIKCFFGPSPGTLFIFPSSLLFLGKKIINFRFDEIVQASLHRVSTTNKTFDLGLTLRAAGTHVFSSIDKADLESITDVFKKHGTNIVNATDTENVNNNDYESEDEEDEDEDEDDEGSEDEDGFIAKDGDEEESEDDDFDPTQIKKKKKKSKANDDESD